MTSVLAVDIGGTTLAAAIINADRAIEKHLEVPVGADPTATLTKLILDMHAEQVQGVGIGSAGPIDVAQGRISPVNIAAWRGFPVTDLTSGLLGGIPVKLAGDAQCMTLGECWLGEHRSLLGVVVSTGVGGGVVLDGEPYLGLTGNAGHIGHITIDRDGEPCPCGGVGCLETVASGPSMVRCARAHGWTGADAKALAAAARAGEPVGLKAFERGAKALATGLLTTAATPVFTAPPHSRCPAREPLYSNGKDIRCAVTCGGSP